MTRKKSKSEAVEWFKALGLAVIIAIVIKSFFFTNYIVEGKSMMPTLKDGNRLIVNKIDYDISQPDRFDVVIFHHNDKEDYVKRVIGLPGDTIRYENDVLYVNGKAVKEPYLKPYKEQIKSGHLTEDFNLKDYTDHKKVPKGKLFVLGDNRRVSSDSRVFGFVDMDQVVGKVNLRYWPIRQFEFMH
ncbi:signal peptidase I [Tuberibacillus sp. Marseille-P3662]|uniref:signal peptidase I n=1 Tax=Tuberibacillus sp. Marseille-P3662 TaxID=1965358 RepID=UPI000A1CD285|nr:signal peptidase I [Tuberibacillus sp. Marseille-P3662]